MNPAGAQVGSCDAATMSPDEYWAAVWAERDRQSYAVQERYAELHRAWVLLVCSEAYREWVRGVEDLAAWLKSLPHCPPRRESRRIRGLKRLRAPPWRGRQRPKHPDRGVPHGVGPWPGARTPGLKNKRPGPRPAPGFEFLEGSMGQGEDKVNFGDNRLWPVGG